MIAICAAMSISAVSVHAADKYNVLFKPEIQDEIILITENGLISSTKDLNVGVSGIKIGENIIKAHKMLKILHMTSNTQLKTVI